MFLMSADVQRRKFGTFDEHSQEYETFTVAALEFFP